MADKKSGSRKMTARILALVIAGVMTISVLLAVILK